MEECTGRVLAAGAQSAVSEYTNVKRNEISRSCALIQWWRAAAFEQLDCAGKIAVSVVLGHEPEKELQEISRRSIPYQMFECNLPDAKRIGSIPGALLWGARIFLEVGVNSDSADLFKAILDAGTCAKIRTGGIIEAVLSTKDVAHFLAQCARVRLPIKPTAGLHHPVRSRYNLTYKGIPPVATMHAFLNVIFAAAVLCFGASEIDACAVLEQIQPQPFSFEADFLIGRDCQLTTAQLTAARPNFFGGFGSCSFTEPIEESRALGWII